MKKTKATTINYEELQLADIQQRPDTEPKPYVELTATIKMGEHNEMIKKIITEDNKE